MSERDSRNRCATLPLLIYRLRILFSSPSFACICALSSLCRCPYKTSLPFFDSHSSAPWFDVGTKHSRSQHRKRIGIRSGLQLQSRSALAF